MSKTSAKLRVARGGSKVRGKVKSMTPKNVTAPGKKYTNDQFSNAGGNTNNTLSGKGLKPFGSAKLGKTVGSASKGRHTNLPGI